MRLAGTSRKNVANNISQLLSFLHVAFAMASRGHSLAGNQNNWLEIFSKKSNFIVADEF